MLLDSLSPVTNCHSAILVKQDGPGGRIGISTYLSYYIALVNKPYM